jgi:hypothetical protein
VRRLHLHLHLQRHLQHRPPGASLQQHPRCPWPPAWPAPAPATTTPLQEHEWLLREKASLGRGEYDFSKADAAKVQDDYNGCALAGPVLLGARRRRRLGPRGCRRRGPPPPPPPPPLEGPSPAGRRQPL